MIGIRVRAARERLGWSQLRLASEAGLAESTVNRIEVGKQQPTLQTLQTIASVLGVSITELVNGRAA